METLLEALLFGIFEGMSFDPPGPEMSDEQFARILRQILPQDNTDLELKALKRSLEAGAISGETYNKRCKELAARALYRSLEVGLISKADYEEKIAALENIGKEPPEPKEEPVKEPEKEEKVPPPEPPEPEEEIEIPPELAGAQLQALQNSRAAGVIAERTYRKELKAMILKMERRAETDGKGLY